MLYNTVYSNDSCKGLAQMTIRALLLVTAIGVSFSLQATPDVSGFWLLILPDSESEIIFTDAGRLIQGEYDLLVDDPSLSCVPASTSRIWANPGSRISIEQTAESILINYELFDLRRAIPIGGESVMPALPSTQNLAGTFFEQMGSSFARYESDSLFIESRNHTHGYIRTSRGIPQSAETIAIEELKIEDDQLRITHTYIDETLYEQPLVLNYTFQRIDVTEIEVYNCTEADYDWFNQLNAPTEEAL